MGLMIAVVDYKYYRNQYTGWVRPNAYLTTASCVLTGEMALLSLFGLAALRPQFFTWKSVLLLDVWALAHGITAAVVSDTPFLCSMSMLTLLSFGASSSPRAYSGGFARTFGSRPSSSSS